MMACVNRPGRSSPLVPINELIVILIGLKVRVS
jgi:hypothetical protein